MSSLTQLTLDHNMLASLTEAVKSLNSQFKNNHYTEMRSGSEEGSYLRLIDGCITQL